MVLPTVGLLLHGKCFLFFFYAMKMIRNSILPSLLSNIFDNIYHLSSLFPTYCVLFHSLNDRSISQKEIRSQCWFFWGEGCVNEKVIHSERFTSSNRITPWLSLMFCLSYFSRLATAAKARSKVRPSRGRISLS